MDSKAELRKLLRARRLAWPAEVRQDCALRIALHAQGLLDWQRIQRIGSYCAVRGEADPAPLNAWLRAQGKQVYLPVTLADCQMRFVLWQGQPLERGEFGIAVPKLTPDSLLASDLDLLLLPLVGFDRRGIRLGSGAGYYDRALATAAPEIPLRIGLAYSFQQLADIPSEAWDIPLHGVITELAALRFGSLLGSG